MGEFIGCFPHEACNPCSDSLLVPSNGCKEKPVDEPLEAMLICNQLVSSHGSGIRVAKNKRAESLKHTNKHDLSTLKVSRIPRCALLALDVP